MASKSSAEDVLFINKDGEISRITRSKCTTSSALSVSQFFRLGKLAYLLHDLMVISAEELPVI